MDNEIVDVDESLSDNQHNQDDIKNEITKKFTQGSSKEALMGRWKWLSVLIHSPKILSNVIRKLN